MNYAIYNVDTGIINRTIRCGPQDIEIQCGDGEAWIEADQVDDSVHQVIDGQIVDRVFSMSELKAEKWAQVKALRDQRVDGGHMGFDTDLVSRTNLMGASLGAVLNPSITIPWKMADNSVVMLTAEEIKTAAEAILAFVTACHEHSQTLGAAIEAADDQAALDAITITDGWPA